MHVLTAGNTVYTRAVAKVMISIPDPLLERVDAYVDASGETRSGFLQRLAEAELDRSAPAKRRELEELLGPPVKMGNVEAAQAIREAREARDARILR